jgi:hypothetical protein
MRDQTNNLNSIAFIRLNIKTTAISKIFGRMLDCASMLTAGQLDEDDIVVRAIADISAIHTTRFGKLEIFGHSASRNRSARLYECMCKTALHIKH